MVRLIGATRNHSATCGSQSPATLSVTAMAKAIALLNNRDFVIPSDVQAVFCDTVAHRLILEPAQKPGAGPPGMFWKNPGKPPPLPGCPELCCATG